MTDPLDETLNEREQAEEGKGGGRSKRQLDPLPDHGKPPSEWREWLDRAVTPAAGYSVHNFLRHGRQRTDACELVLLGEGGERRSYEIPEQRLLSTPATLRATLVSVTDGLVRPRSMTRAEQEDIWIAFVTLATVTAHQSDQDETREWLEATIEQAEPVTGLSLVPERRPDGLRALLARNTFGYVQARKFTDPAEVNPPRPTLLVDSHTGERWMRVGDVAAFWRHVLGVGTMSQPTIDGRLAAVGVKRHEYPVKVGRSVHTVRLYRVGDGGEAR